MATRRQIIEAALFLPAMALLAVVLYGGFYLVIIGGSWLLRAWYWLGANALALPRPLALALAAMATACTVYGAVYALGRGRRWRRRRVSVKA